MAEVFEETGTPAQVAGAEEPSTEVQTVAMVGVDGEQEGRQPDVQATVTDAVCDSDTQTQASEAGVHLALSATVTENGVSGGTAGYSYSLEAIQILRAKGSSAPVATYKGATQTARRAFAQR